MRRSHTDGTNYSMTLIGKNIFYLNYLDDSDMDLEKVKEVRDKGFDLHGEKPFYSIVDLRDNFASMSADGKDLIANDELLNRLRICEAILVNNIPMKLVIVAYMKFHKPKSPTRVFRRLEDLYKWFAEYAIQDADLEQLKDFFESTAVEG